MYCIKENIIPVSKYKNGFVLQTAHIFAQPCCRRVILYKVTSRKLFQLCNISMYILRTTLYVGWYTKLKNCILIMRWYLNEEWLSLIAMRNFKPYIIIIVHYSFLKYNPSCGLRCIFIAFIFLMEQLRNMLFQKLFWQWKKIVLNKYREIFLRSLQQLFEQWKFEKSLDKRLNKNERDFAPWSQVHNLATWQLSILVTSNSIHQNC